MTDRLNMNRRQFVVTTAVVGGGMAIGVEPGLMRSALAAGEIEVNPWVLIAPDGIVTVRVGKADIGNGTSSTVAMFVCEELACDWAKVQLSATDPTFDRSVNKVFSGKMGGGAFGGNRSIPHLEQAQQAGASARERLKAAAAAEWSVPVGEITVANGEAVHARTSKKAGFGALAARAATIKLDAEPKIKTADQWTLLGKGASRLDVREKVNGSAIFGLDVRLPNMLYAAVRQSPAQGGKLKSFNADAVKGLPGVHSVVAVGTGEESAKVRGADNSALQAAVAVVADTYWHAKTALDVLPIEWDNGPGGGKGTEDLRKEFFAAMEKPGMVAQNKGDAMAAMKTASKVIEAVYETPYADHALMEPLNATVLVAADRVDVWVSTQGPDKAMSVASDVTGVAADKVHYHNVVAGGGFGRRTVNDETRLAVAIAAKVPGRPVKTVQSREETMRQGRYRPMALSKFQAGIGADGLPVAWFNRHVSHSTGQQYDAANFKGLDASALRTLQVDNAYSIPNTLVEYHAMQTNLLTGPWRGPGANQNAFKIESFVDEVALAGGKDPLELRRWLLREAKDAGWLKVLNEAASKSNWGKPLPKGSAQGMAICLDHGTIICEVAEVTVSQSGELKVHSIDIAFDTGRVMNPDGVKNQMEGGVMFGLNMALNEQITVRNGRVVEGNFDDYPMIRIDQAPKVNVHFGGLTGGDKLMPVGEPPTPPVPPAVSNAIFRATGKRIRSLPLRNHDLSWS